MIGFDNTGTITKSYATGNVAYTTSSSYLGGLVGFNDLDGTISDSYATGNAIASAAHYDRQVGGLVGINYGGNITHNYAIGTVTPGTRNDQSVTAGHGLVGNNPENQEHSTVTASYWDTETTGQATDDDSSASEVGVGKTTTQLQTPTSAAGIYEDWDSETWDLGTDSKYPILKGVAGQD